MWAETSGLDRWRGGRQALRRGRSVMGIRRPEREACKGSGQRTLKAGPEGPEAGPGVSAPAVLSHPGPSSSRRRRRGTTDRRGARARRRVGGQGADPGAGGARRGNEVTEKGAHLRTISKYSMTNTNSSTIKYSVFADLFLITP